MTLTIIYTGIRDISYSSSFYDIPDDKLLDGFILRDTASTVGASYMFGVTSTLLAASIITPLRRL